MGLTLSTLSTSLMQFIWPSPKMRCLMMGLDAAGKTTILFKLKVGEVVVTIPSIGFNVETVEYKNFSITCWDIGTRDRLRQKLWRHYYPNTEACIFVVDANDRDRVEQAREELFKLINEPALPNCSFLVLANKQDIPDAMSATEMCDKLGLNECRNRQWFIQGASSRTGDGLYEGLDWLAAHQKAH